MTDRSIVTLAEMKLYLSPQLVSSDLDVTLETWIDLCSGQIEEYLERKVNAQEVEEVLNGTGTQYLYPSWTPTIRLHDDSLSSLQVRDSSGIGPWSDLLSDIDLLWFDLNGFAWRLELLGGNIFPIGTRNIRLQHITGWNEPPAVIKKNCLERVQIMWNESQASKQGRLGVQSETDNSVGGGGLTRSFTQDILSKLNDEISGYRRLS